MTSINSKIKYNIEHIFNNIIDNDLDKFKYNFDKFKHNINNINDIIDIYGELINNENIEMFDYVLNNHEINIDNLILVFRYCNYEINDILMDRIVEKYHVTKIINHMIESNPPINLIIKLVKRGADVNILLNEQSILSMLCNNYNPDMEIINKIINDVNDVNAGRTNPLLNAIINKSFELTKFLLEHGCKHENALLFAIIYGTIDMCKLLIEYNYDINYNNGSCLKESIKHNDYDKVKLLLENGADVNYINNYHNDKYDKMVSLTTSYDINENKIYNLLSSNM